MIQRAKSIIHAGKLGRIVTVHGFFWLMKPDDYFDTPWRRELGAGPVLMNLAHDIDLLRYLCGFLILDEAFKKNYGDRLRLERVRLYETPNCWADATRAHHGI